jgi:hypothetical protein
MSTVYCRIVFYSRTATSVVPTSSGAAAAKRRMLKKERHDVNELSKDRAKWWRTLERVGDDELLAALS